LAAPPRDRFKTVATHAVFAATVKYSPRLGDFLDLVVRDLYGRFEPILRPRHWDRYLEDCRNRDPAMPDWSPATRDSLRTRVFGMMTEAGYLSDSRGRQLRPVQVATEVAHYLRESNEDYVLSCMELTRSRGAMRCWASASSWPCSAKAISCSTSAASIGSGASDIAARGSPSPADRPTPS